MVGNLTGKYSVVTKHLLFPSFSVVCFTAKGLFPLSRNFSMRTHVDFTRANKIEAMYERPQVNAKVEPRSTFTFTRGLSYIASILFTRVNFTCLRTEKLRYIGNKTLK